MIKIFSDPVAAQKLCDEIHKYLQENCKDYSASCWQIPVKAVKSELYYVQIPVEYKMEMEDKPLYFAKSSMSECVMVFSSKAVQTVEKLPADFTLVVEPVETKEEPIEIKK